MVPSPHSGWDGLRVAPTVVGDLIGEAVGALTGEVVGAAVGVAVGIAVGKRLGLNVGLNVIGVAVGAAVGAKVSPVSVGSWLDGLSDGAGVSNTQPSIWGAGVGASSAGGVRMSSATPKSTLRLQATEPSVVKLIVSQ